MNKQKKTGGRQAELQEIPLGQRLFDNTFALLIVSIVISGLVYNVWGLVETLGIPRFVAP
ncbi:MAG: hypothetical protein QG637_1067 [Chloroflexota bacterium]|nr:hypothetical protein [Chloroflexota bacterium]